MADKEQAPIVEESQAVKNLLYVIETLGDSLSNAEQC